MTLEPGHIIQIGGLVASLLIAPTLWKIGAHYVEVWKEAREARLQSAITGKLSSYVTTEIHDMTFETLQQHQTAMHEQNLKLLDTIRNEAFQREGRIIGSIDSLAKQNRDEVAQVREEVSKVHVRVDRVLELSGDRRRS